MIGKLTFSKILFLIVFVFTATLLSNAQIVPVFGAYGEDPKKILTAADQSINKLRNISYEAEYEGNGAAAVNNRSIVGKVSLANLEAKNDLLLKLSARGKRYDSTTGEAEPFDVSFADKTIFRLRPGEKSVVRKVISDTVPEEREFAFVTGLLGAVFSQLAVFEFLSSKTFERLMAGEILEYEGLTVINGVRCHVIYAEYNRQPDGKTRKQRWFFGTKDYLPRKIESISTNDKGRYGANTLTLSNLRVNALPDSQSFAVKLPQGYKIKNYENPPKPSSLLPVGVVAPEWSLKDANGKAHLLSDYRGKVVVMDFWATYCGPCVKTMPDLQALHTKYEKRGVKVIGINSWEEENAAAYFNDKKYSYELVLNGETIVPTYPVNALPTIYIIGVDGRIIYSSTTPNINLTTFIEDCLKKHEM